MRTTYLILLATACALPARAEDLKRLDAAELERTLVGNTITGTGRTGCTFYDYYTADGAAASKCGSYADTGRWEIADDRFCLTWSKRQGKNCIELYRRGSDLVMKNPRMGEALHPVSILPGDARR